MKKISIASALLCLCTIAQAQYKNDNVLYKTVFPQDLCRELAEQKGYLLLDVRSKGEYEDTSSSAGYNLGRLKGATHINVRELGPRLGELSAYKDKPVFVYCSHSQRSRRASKMLADSGFKKVFNVNGGVTGLRQFYTDDCLQQLMVTKVGYKVMAPAEFCDRLSRNDQQLFILDVRSDSFYNHISGDAKVDAYGHFAGSVHIPAERLSSSLDRIPKDKEIVIVDMYGDEASKAAAWLKEKNYPKVSVLLEGVDRYLLTDKSLLKCNPGAYVAAASFGTITAPELNRLLLSSKEIVFIDIREKEEYEGKHKDSWRNIGRIRGAMHIPSSELKEGAALTLPADRVSPTYVIYAFGSSKEAFAAAQILSKKSKADVQVLMGGLFNLRWTAANVKGNTDLIKWVEGVPEENL